MHNLLILSTCSRQVFFLIGGCNVSADDEGLKDNEFYVEQAYSFVCQELPIALKYPTLKHWDDEVSNVTAFNLKHDIKIMSYLTRHTISCHMIWNYSTSHHSILSVMQKLEFAGRRALYSILWSIGNQWSAGSWLFYLLTYLLWSNGTTLSTIDFSLRS